MSKLVKESLYNFERGKKDISSLGIGKITFIEKWLDEMEIENYIINDDLTINVNDNVNLSGKKLSEFPSYIQFNKVNGSFNCALNNLKSLNGCPQYVKGWFGCSSNYLTSLEGCPNETDEDFYCALQQSGHIFTEDDVKKYCKVEGSIIC